MPENKENKWLKWIGNIMAISAFLTFIWGGIGYLFEPRIESFIMHVVDKNKGSSTRGDLAEEMDVRKEFVAIEIGTMYRDFKQAQENIELFNNTWIPFLENEKTFYYIGFFVDISNPNNPKVKYRDIDGEVLPCWHDDQGWYFMKQGYKYYN
jgi:hypothetical protein